MLKIYCVQSFYQVNHQGWVRCGTDDYKCQDDGEAQEKQIIFERKHFNEAYDLIERLRPDGLYCDTTLFGRPYIGVDGWNCRTPQKLFPKSVYTLSYKLVYKEVKYATLDWISEHLTADEAIQYFKERGMTVCPIKLH